MSFTTAAVAAAHRSAPPTTALPTTAPSAATSRGVAGGTAAESTREGTCDSTAASADASAHASADVTRVGVDAGGLELRSGAFAPKLLQRSADGRSVRIALVGARALLLAGDLVVLHVHVGAGCTLELVEVAATVAYDGRGGPPAIWSTRIDLAAGARLRWNAEPLIIADGAHLQRSTHIDLAAGAVARLREQLVLGRSGESGGAVLLRTRARLQGRVLLAEDLDLRDPQLRRSPAVLGDHRRLDTFTVLGEREQAPQALQLQGPGTLLRNLA
ncbi:urease accessory protein UreD [Kineococcus sp. SYSU DK006]|uniref:urease accessory protein UreD n=1 Tax=Kineococcus sp. SYSU DK006 TaxID=3383127 RepID=UPI003D7D201C